MLVPVSFFDLNLIETIWNESNSLKSTFDLRSWIRKLIIQISKFNNNDNLIIRISKHEQRKHLNLLYAFNPWNLYYHMKHMSFLLI